MSDGELVAEVTRRQVLERGSVAGIAGVAHRSPALLADLSPTPVKTSNYTASPGEFVPVDASQADVAITLPAKPVDRSAVGVKVIAIAAPHVVSVVCGNSDLLNEAGGPTFLALASVDQGVLLQYEARTSIWYEQADALRLDVARGAAKLGTDGTVGGPSGSSLSKLVAIVSAPNNFTANQTVTAAGTGAPLAIRNQGSALAITMETDWSNNTTGDITYDSVDIFHKSAGDGVYVVHLGGVSQAHLTTGSVALDNGIAWVQAYVQYTAGNTITVELVVSGLNTRLSVSVSGKDVTVNVATDGSGNPTSTAADVIAAVQASSSVTAVATAYPLTDSTGTSDGTGVVAAVPQTNLAGAYTTGGSGGNAALNVYVPYFKGDTGSGPSSGNVNYRMGRLGLFVQNISAYDNDGCSIIVNHCSGGPALNIFNQQPGTQHVPHVPGNNIAMAVTDYSSKATLQIGRRTAPAKSGGWAAINIGGLATGKWGAFAAALSDNSASVWLNNDGSAAFGRALGTPGPLASVPAPAPSSGAPVMHQIHKTDNSTVASLYLSNDSSSLNTGSSIVFQTHGQWAGTIWQNLDGISPSLSSSFHFAINHAGASVEVLKLENSGIVASGHAAQQYAAIVQGYDAGLQVTTDTGGGGGVLTLDVRKNSTNADTAIRFINQGPGVTLDIQVGSPAASVWQIDSSGNINVVRSAGLKIGTAGGSGGQKLGFYNATPVAQPLLATGASHAVDDVIRALQTLGLVRQS